MSDRPETTCDGLCVTAADIGITGNAVAYPHPGCPLHSPGRICECGEPDRCLSPTHGQVSMAEARAIRNSQRRGAGGSVRTTREDCLTMSDSRTELRDRIATAIYDRSASSLNASNWLYAHDAEHLADAVMELFCAVRRSPLLPAGYVIVELADAHA